MSSVKILMVCLGNICRSPLAEGILKSKAPEALVVIDSAGTSAYHVGEAPDPRSVEVAKKHGIDISSQRGRQFSRADFGQFDIIYTMDKSNYNAIIAMAPNEESKAKVRLILNELYPGENRNVPDPYYGGDHGFENVFNMLDQACDRILESIL